jgi:selenocysteine-specific elongation factor
LLDRERLLPGDVGWVQLRARQPLAVLKGDRFIVRRPSPSVTIGGGEVVDPDPPRHRRFRPEVIGALETLAVGEPDEIVLQAIASRPREVRALREAAPSGLSAEQVNQALDQLIAEGEVVALGRPLDAPVRPVDFVVGAAGWATLLDRLRQTIAEFHAAQPLRGGMPREEIRSRLGLTPARLVDDLIAGAGAAGAVVDQGQTVRLTGFRITLDPVSRRLADRYLAALDAIPFTPPAPAEFGIDGATLGALEDLGEVVRVADGVVFAPSALAEMVRATLELIDREGPLTLARFRDHFATSRKYAQATLEYLDQRRITRRIGDERVRYAGHGAATQESGTMERPR